jgi:hypothetical protein
MKDRKKKTRREAEGLKTLSPEDQALLKEQLSRLKAALATEGNPEALKALVTTRPGDLPWDLHLMEELARIPHAAMPALISALFTASPDKPRRKAMKRALHTLRTRGVPVPPDLIPREEPGLLAPAPTPAFVAHLSPVFTEGERYIILESSREVLKGNFLLVRLNDRTGLRECHLLIISRKQRQEVWEEFRKDGLGDWVQCPPAYALRLLEEALALTPPGEPAREEFLPLREILWRHLGRPDEAPTLESLLPLSPFEESPPSPEEVRRVAASQPLLALLPRLADLDPWLDKLEEIQRSPLILTEHQQQQRQTGVFIAAAQAFYPPETRSLWARRFLEMAYFFHLMGKSEESRVLRRAAQDLRSGDTTPLTGENWFILELTRRALSLAWELRKGRELEAPSSLLLAPPSTPLIIGR